MHNDVVRYGSSRDTTLSRYLVYRVSFNCTSQLNNRQKGDVASRTVPTPPNCELGEGWNSHQERAERTADKHSAQGFRLAESRRLRSFSIHSPFFVALQKNIGIPREKYELIDPAARKNSRESCKRVPSVKIRIVNAR